MSLLCVLSDFVKVRKKIAVWGSNYQFKHIQLLILACALTLSTMTTKCSLKFQGQRSKSLCCALISLYTTNY